MEFAEVIRRRRMVRQFSDRPLAPEVVERVLASALRAPSAGNTQGRALLCLTKADDLTRFWPFVSNQVKYTPAMQQAPLVVVPLAHKAAYLQRYAEADKGWEEGAEAKWPAPYWFIDTGMSALMMLLSAVDEGLGAFFFWIMPPSSEVEGAVPAHLDAFRAEFGVPAEYTPVGAIAIGYRAADLQPQSPHLSERRHSLREAVHQGHWGQH